jgi:tRNA threonylcarbamoyl adenosine modification protein (Sua5/YciO/YrdC/YwlC family)
MTPVTKFLPATTDAEREEAVTAAAAALARGELVVLPTDTVYGIAADAFSPDSVQALLDAKGRGRQMPPPVLVATTETLDALAVRIPDWARALAGAFWPGPLTMVFHQQSSLQWDLGETRATVAIRVPDDAIALAVLERTGPLAVSSANVTGAPAATNADEAEVMLGESVAVIVDGGQRSSGQPASDLPSTIVDATNISGPRLLRLGALSIEELNEVLAEHGVEIASDE